MPEISLFSFTDYIHKKPLRCYVGSITDECILREAMLGVQSVIHIAGVTDSSMFPNETRIWEVNVKGIQSRLFVILFHQEITDQA